jgi:hypothetical protein
MGDLRLSLDRELKLFRNLLKTTQQLEECVGQKTHQELKSFFARREKILAKISAREENIRIFGKSWKKLTAEETSRLVGVADEIRNIVSEIIDMDRRIEQTLKAQKDEIHDRLITIRQGHKALKGYTPYRMGIPRFIDRRNL